MRSSKPICSSIGAQLVALLGADVPAEPVARRRRSAGTPPRAARAVRCGTVDMPDTIVIGNSRPLAAWMVMMRTASSSVSGRTASATRAPSGVCSSTQCRYWRRLPPVASLHARAWSMTNRSRRHTSRGGRRRSRARRPAGRGRCGRAAPTAPASALVVQRAQVVEAGRDGIVGGNGVGLGGEVAPAAAAFDLEAEQVVVATREQRRAQGGDDVQVVGRVVDGAQHHQQVAHRPGGVDERAATRPGTGCAAASSASCRNGSEVRAGTSTVMSPRRAGRQPVASSSTDQPSSMARAIVGGDLVGLGRSQVVGAVLLRMLRLARARRPAGPTGGAGADGVERRCSRAATERARRRRAARP